MIRKQDIEKLNRIRQEKRRLEKLDKELTEKLLQEADKTEKAWKNIAYEITEGKTTFPNREEINKLPDCERYYKTTTYPKIVIATGK